MNDDVFMMRRGGGAALNFKVVGGTTAPANPKENTIWVNTAADISQWVFSPEAPVSPVEGMVWIQTGTSSPASFNALKKNGITICPLSCMQYISGAWAGKAAKTHQSGAWVEWVRWLYNNGDECLSVGGNWIGVGKKPSSSTNHTASAPTITKEGSTVRISCAGGQYAGNAAIYYKEDKIAFANNSAINIKCDISDQGDGSVRLCVWSAIGTYSDDNRIASLLLSHGSNDTSLDVSSLAAGAYYVGFQVLGGGQYNAAAITLAELQIK